MRRALELARRGIGTTSPNPRVGACVVKGGRLIAEGYHARAGQPHAEAIALARAGARARGATLYVTLEPCAHTGRTPPCAPLVAASGLRRVVVGEPDPNPLTARRGLALLERSGLEVTLGVLGREARALNLPFRKWVTTGLPYVTLKAAESLDGKIATRTGRSRWISSPAARRFAHGLRAAADAVLVGVGTVLRDDPRLDARDGGGRRPAKVVLDSRLRIRGSSRLFRTRGRTIVATTARAARSRRAALAPYGEVLVLPARSGRVALRPLLRELGRRGVLHVLVEGGGETIGSFVDERLADEAYFILAPRLIGGRSAPGPVGGRGAADPASAPALSGLDVGKLGPDVVVHGYFK
jgi:diaminohydroxyphosphoribosylaminopyrimidine deaminase/5-amino-6-(5-phosphoribosylamino)uracil reductase